MTLNEHVYATCCRPEVDGDVISGVKVKTIEGYAVLYFEVASSNSFRDIPKTFRRRRTSTIALSENALHVSLNYTRSSFCNNCANLPTFIVIAFLHLHADAKINLQEMPAAV